MRFLKRKPSPALIVSIVAICAALVGTAFAAPIASDSRLNRQDRQVAAKIARQITARFIKRFTPVFADRQITDRAPGLSVANANNADEAENADRAASVDDGAVGTQQLADGAVTNGKIADGAVGASKLGPDAQPAAGYATSTTGTLSWNEAEQVVRSLTLPAGSFIVTGYVNANNNDVSVESVQCRITLGGTTIGSTDTIRLGENTALDRQVLTVTGGGTLAEGGQAQLRCNPSTSLGNWLDRGMTAIRVASLN